MSTTCLVVPDLIADEEREQLLAEAQAQRPTAQRCDRPGSRIVDANQFLGPAHFWYSLDGELRRAVHRRVAERAGARIDVPLHPVQSNYLYYGPGDSLGLHHDQARCPYAVVALLSGDAEPLCVHSELAGVPPTELDSIADPATHRGGTKIELADGPMLISGGVIPHHRDPHGGSNEIVLVTFCFGLEPIPPAV
jgi:hypothetical protein